MAEDVTITDGAELAWQKRAIWLLLRRLGGEVVISDREWESVPDEPDLILARTDGAMRWVARLVSPALPAADAVVPGEVPLPFPEAGT